MATASPSYALFFGAQYLARAANDAALSTAAAFTISVTFDPNASEAAQSGTIVAKHHAITATRQGWLVEYNSSTFKVSLTVFDSSGNWVKRETSANVRIRANVTFTFNAGTIAAYVNGAASDGTLTNSGTVTAANVSVEPLSIGAHSTSASPVSPFKGAVHAVMYWSTARSGANIGTMLPDGLLGSAFDISDGDLQAAWLHTGVAAQSNSDFSAWVDAKNSLALTRFKISGTREVKAQGTTGAVINSRLWDGNLTDQALYSVGLTTTYPLGSGANSSYRIWSAGLTEPQIASNYASTENDFTILLRTRRVFSKVSSIYLKKYGIQLEFNNANREMFLIIGADTSSTLQNKRISFGQNIFPVNGVSDNIDAVIVLRYNAISKDADLFINQIGYVGTEVLTTTNAFQTTTGLILSEGADFLAAAITPACLSDTQVDTFVLGLSPLVYTASYLPPQTYFIDPVVVGADRVVAAIVDADPGDHSIPTQTANISTSPQAVAATYALGFYTPFDSKPLVDDPQFIDPNPVVTSVTLSGGAITAIGQAGPTDAYLCRSWWEIELVPNQLQALGSSTYPRDFFTQRLAVNDTFTVPNDVNLAGRAAVLVVQPQKNSKQTFRSAPYIIDVVAPTDPVPNVTAAVIDAVGLCSATVVVGSTNAGPCTTWWEMETGVASNIYARTSGITTNANFAAGATVNEQFALGTPTGWTGRRLRFVINPDGASTVFFRSAGYTLTDFAYTNPGATITNVTVNAYRLVTAQGQTGISNMVTANVWWELEVTPGEFIATIDRRTGVDVTSSQLIADTFTIPGNFPLTGKNLRLAVQSAAGAVTFYSAPFVMSNPTINAPTITINSASCSLTKLLTANANLGTSNLTNARLWWEVEYTAGQFTAVLGTVASISLASSSVRNLSYQFPDRFSLSGKSIRLVVQSTDDLSAQWLSAPFAITQITPTAPTPVVSSATLSAINAVNVVSSIPASNLSTVEAWIEMRDTGSTYKVITGTQATLALHPTNPTAFNVTKLFDQGPPLDGNAVRVGVRSNQFPELTWYSTESTLTISTGALPNPVANTANENLSGQLSLSGTAGPTDIGLCDVWFEVNVVSGTFDGVMLKQTGVNLSSATTISGQVNLPGRVTLAGKSVTLVVTPTGKPQTRFVSSAIVVNVATTVTPDPLISAASISAIGSWSSTATVNAASNLGAINVWWEISFGSVLLERIGFASYASAAAVPNPLTYAATLPGKQNFTGRQVRLAVQQDARPDVIYYSANANITIGTMVGTPTVTSAVYGIDSVLNSSVSIPGSNNLGAGTEWWEVEITPNVFISIISRRAVTHAVSAHTTSIAVTLPDRFSLQGKSIRYAFSPTGWPEIVVYSALVAVDAQLISDPTPLIQTFESSPFGLCTGTVRAGPTNAAFCRTWWEVVVDAELIARFDQTDNVNLFSQQVVPGSFELPRTKRFVTYDYTNRTVRFAVQTNIRPELVYYSPAVLLNIPAPINPEPQVLSAIPTSFAGEAGPSNIGTCVAWWELKFPGGAIMALPNPQPVEMNARNPVLTTVDLPGRIDYRQAELYLAVSPLEDRALEYRSLPFLLLDDAFNFARCLRTSYPVRPVWSLTLMNLRSVVVPFTWRDAEVVVTSEIDGGGEFVFPEHIDETAFTADTTRMIDAGEIVPIWKTVLLPIPAPYITVPEVLVLEQGRHVVLPINMTGAPALVEAIGLPTGLQVDGLIIRGSPTGLGEYAVEIAATNLAGTGFAQTTITVVAATPEPIPSTSPVYLTKLTITSRSKTVQLVQWEDVANGSQRVTLAAGASTVVYAEQQALSRDTQTLVARGVLHVRASTVNITGTL